MGLAKTARARVVAGVIVALVALVAVAYVASEYVEGVDARVVRDPFWNIAGLSATSAPSGSVIRVRLGAGAPDRTIAEFIAGGRRMYSRAMPSADGAAVVVPLVRGATGETPGHLRLIAPRGALWSASSEVAFTIGASPTVAAPAGSMSLFALEVARALLTQSEAWAAAAARGGAAVPAAYAESIGAMRVQVERLSAELAAVAVSSADRATIAGSSATRSDLSAADRVLAAQLAGWGPASASPCGDAKDREVSEAAADRAAGPGSIRASATRFARSLATCPAAELGELARRARSWTAIAAREMADDIIEAPKWIGLHLLTVAAIHDTAVDSARVWRSYAEGRDLRALLVERRGEVSLGSGDDVYVSYDSPSAGRRVTLKLGDEMRKAAEQNTFLGRIIDQQRKARALEDALLDVGPPPAEAQAQVARVAPVMSVAALPTGAPVSPPVAPPTATTTATPVVPATPASPVGPAVSALPVVPPVPPPVVVQPAPTTAAPAVAATTAPLPTTAAPAPAATTSPPTPAPTLTTTLTPARDLAGTWRGGIVSFGHYQGQTNCKWTGSATFALTQSGATLGGQATLTFTSSQALLAGAECTLGTEQYGVSGTVSASAVTFRLTGGQGAWYGTFRGSVTTDLMYATFAGSGEDYGTGCVQLSRTGIGALPGCSQ